MKTLNIDYALPNLQKIDNLDPNDYEIIGMIWKEFDGESVTFEIDFSGDYDFGAFHESEICANILKMAENKSTRCNHCNKMIQYVMIGVNTKDGTINIFGNKCTENISMYKGMSFEQANKRSLASFVKLKNEAKREKFLADHEGLEEALKLNNHVVKNIRDYFYKFFTLSQKQIDFVFKSVESNKEFLAKNELREAEANDVPEGRQFAQEYIVISIKKECTSFGGNESLVLKSCIEHKEDKYRVYGNLPSSFIREFDSGELKVGAELKLTATLSVSDKNKKFGYFKRAVGAK